MKPSEIYLRAAEIIENDESEFACNAIAIAVLGVGYLLHERNELPEVVRFTELFKPTDAYLIGWGNQWSPDNDMRQKACRVQALCLMSAIAKWEETHEKI